jgi:uncharacterized membrane protein YphA (DoxX/SURF4 family)
MKPYPWSCLACEETNAAERSSCTRCGCPALATSAQVDAARAGYRQRIGLPPMETPDLTKLLEGVPLLLVGAAVLALAGGLALVVGSNVSVLAFGGLMLALAALCVSSYRKEARA